MNITSVEAAAWDVPMRAPYRSAQRVTTTARNVLVTVTLEDGTRGYGESAPATYVTGETQESVLEWVRDFAPRLRGLDTAAAAALAAPGVGRAPGAAGALEMALEDAAARAAGRPFFDRDGTHFRNRPTARATDLSLPILPPDEASARAADAARQGFRALKIKVGGGDLEADVARVRAVADAAPDASLRLDGNQGFSPEAALRLVDRIADLLPRVTLLEQPTKAGDDAAMRAVAERVPMPVFADESVHGAEDARRLLETGVCRGVVLKVAKSGISETEQIARVARDLGAPCLFGCMMETRVAIGAALRMAISFGTDVVPYLDLDGHLLVNDAGLADGGFLEEGDVLRVDPEVPGLGVAVRLGGSAA